MTTVKQAKETTIFVISENGFPEETNLYDWVMNFEDENKLHVEYREDIELDEETGNYVDNGKYRLLYCKVNRPAVLLNEEFDTKEDAEDECFNRIYKYDFQNSCENTIYFETKEECEAQLVEDIHYGYSVDKDVATSIYRKSEIVFEGRELQNKIHRAKITAENNARKARLAIEVPAEAASLIIDEQFKAAVKWANEATGQEKSQRSAAALKGLLERNGRTEITSDFWQVYRILKAQTDPKQ